MTKMKAVLAAGFVGLGLTAAGSAAAQTVPPIPIAPYPMEERYVDMFVDFCLSTGGRAPEAMAAADAAGWGPLSSDLLEPSEAAPIRNGRSTVLTLAGARRRVILATSSSPPGDRQAHVCFVDPTDLPSLDLETVIRELNERIGVRALRPIEPFNAKYRESGAPLAAGDYAAKWIVSGDGPYTDESETIRQGRDAFDLGRERSIYAIGVALDGRQPVIVHTRMGP